MPNLKNKKAMIFLGIVLVLVIVYVSFANYHNGSGKKLTNQEVDNYISEMQRNITKDSTGVELSSAEIEQVRYFGYNDDGKSFYMINLMRANEKPMYPAGHDYPGNVADAKKRYVDGATALLLKKLDYPVVNLSYASREAMSQGSGELEKFDQFYLIRYKNRKDFMELISNPAYAPIAMHKFAADKDTILIPITTGDIMNLNQIVLFATIALIWLASEVMGGWRKIFAVGRYKEELSKEEGSKV
ncbi:hypothetical protein [Romboutsia sp.]|uniref:hypothetical protein n=1 Tax=Romboutsia sp. TaxID=1965302 RepID=UPI003F3BCB36